MEMLQLLDEEGWCAGSKPVVLQQAVAEGVEQTERIEDSFCAAGKMITIVFELDLCIHRLRRQLEVLCHCFDVLFENRLHFLLRKTADDGETGEQRDVLQVVDGGEDAQL